MAPMPPPRDNHGGSDGDELSRMRLPAAPLQDDNANEIERIRRILSLRPHSAERAAPALVLYRDSVVIALAHLVPAAGAALTCRFHLDSGTQVASRIAARIDPSPEVLLRWSAIGHDDPPRMVWRCHRPPPCDDARCTAIEVRPDPRSFNEAMLIARCGAGRVLVLERPIDASAHASTAVRAAVMPSGWSHASPPRDARWLCAPQNDRLDHRQTTTTATPSRRQTT